MGFFFAQRFILSPAILCIILFTSPSLASQPNLTPTTRPSAYEVLEEYNFPVGLLPKGVVDYYLDPLTGNFSASFGGSCSFSLEGSYQLKYQSTIKGYISKGKLATLEGVSVKLLFLWVNIVEVQRNGDNIGFSIGIAGADFSIDNFEECPQCGCGLNCIDEQLEEVRTNPSVSSY